MKPKLIIIKLGGSVVTDKDSQTPKARISIINRIAREIKQLFHQKRYQFILVHGAGSFGHPLAKKYNLQNGTKTEEQKFGFSLTTQKMLELNSIIMDALHSQSIPAISIPPHSFIKQSKGKVQNFNAEITANFLDQGLVPVLFGDVVLDNKWGCSIISGDVIVPYLAKKLKADQVIFLSDIDGIFDADPKKNPRAKLIPEITDKNLRQVLKGLTPTGRADVTGEMYGKIMEIKNNLKKTQVVIVNGLKRDSLKQAITSSLIGTKLYFSI